MTRAPAWIAVAAVLAAGAPVPVCEASDRRDLDVVLLVDTSESMAGIGTEAILDFADSFRPSQRLGVVSFGEKPQIVHPLGSAAADADRAALKKAVGKLEFSQTFKDFPGGLELALTHLTTEGRKDADRVVILLSSGLLTPAHDYSSHEDVLKYIRDHSLYDYYLEEIPIYAVAFGEGADIPLMQEMGSSTRGKYLVAPDAEALDDVFSVLLDGIQPPATDRDVQLAAPPEASVPGVVPQVSGPGDDAPPSFLTWVLAVLVGFLVVVNLAVLVLLAVNTSRMSALIKQATEPPAEKRAEEPPEFTSLRKTGSEISSLLAEAREKLDGFTVDLEDYGAQNWEREKTLRKQYHGITGSLFLLLDHVDVEKREGRASVDLDWIEQRTRKLLEQERIREIPVSEGDEFDGMYHKHAGDRPHATPAGTVLEVTRRGYYVPGGGGEEDDLILRHAEVVVSRGKKAT